MPDVIRGHVFNKTGTRPWYQANVLLIRESDGEIVAAVLSDKVGYFSFTVSDTVTVYSVLADASGVSEDKARQGVTSGLTGVTV